MSTMFGADADALDEVARDLERRAERVRTMRVRLARAIHASPWEGPSAHRFRQQWDGEHAPTLLAAAGFLDAAGDLLRQNAAQQRDASGDEGPTGSGGGDGTGPGASGSGSDRSLIDEGDLGRSIKLLLGLHPAIGTAILANDLRQLLQDLIEGDATAQQFEDRVLDVFGAVYRPVGVVLAIREAVGIALPEEMEEDVLTMAGLDPTLDEWITALDLVRRGEGSSVDWWTVVPIGPLRIESTRQTLGNLLDRVL